MFGSKQFDDFTKRIVENLPPGLSEVHEDVRNNIQAALSGAVDRMELVTREEFEVQRAVLERTRAKLESLERKVAELEAQLKDGI